MARNKVQSQKGLSEAGFDRQYGSEEQCRAALAKWRWPDGFVCPRCGGGRHSLIKTRALYQCTACRRQTSLTAGTIFAATKLSLRSWFRALYHLTQSKQGISSLELGRRLGVTQTTAWTAKHKLKQVMMERDATKRLIGRVEMDDAYLGGQRSGGKRGRGAAGKTPIVATVETTAEGRPVRLKLRRVRGFRRTEIENLGQAQPGCRLHRRQRCSVVLPRRHRGRLHASADPHRLRPQSGADTRLQVGQYRAGQHQDGDRRHLSRDPRQARPALSGRVRVPLQPPLRPRCHAPTPRLGCRPHPADAVPSPQIG